MVTGVFLTEPIAQGGREILCRRALSLVENSNLKPTDVGDDDCRH